MRIHWMSAIVLLAGCKGLTPGDGKPVPTTGQPPITVPVTTTGGGTTVVTTPGVSCTDPTLPTQAENVIGNACEACHGPSSLKYDGFGDALDPAAMVTDGWVVPNHSDQSKVYLEISPQPNGDPPLMPTSQGGGPLIASEIAVVKQWIDCGAEDWTLIDGGSGTGVPPASARGFITPEMEFLAAKNDAATLTTQSASLNEPDQVNARYISLVNLYNAGVPTDRIQLFAQAINKAMWNLTEAPNPKNLVPVNMDGLVLPFNGGTVSVSDGLGQTLLWRVDEKNWLWDANSQGADHDNWEELLKAYPYGIKFDDTLEEAADLVNLTHSRIPIIHGDWFNDRGGIAPLYFDILNEPADFDQYYQQFGGFNEIDQLNQATDVNCVGMDGNASLVSNFNRVQCRFGAAINGYCWNSSDFASGAGAANIFSNPLGFVDLQGNLGNGGARAGGEAFCALPDGQQSWFVFANKVAQGQGNIRLDDAPSNVVTDYSPDSDRVVHTASSCWHCHESGTIERDDTLLQAVQSNSGFDQATKQQVADLFPGNDVLPSIYQRDIASFTNALNVMGVAVGEEPTWAMNRDYEAPLVAERVGSAFGLRPEQFLGEIQVNSALQAQYGSLGSGSGSTADFQIVEGAALSTICDLSLGDDCNAADLATFEAGGTNFQFFCGEVRNGFFVGNAVPCPNNSTCNAEGECTTF